MVRLRSVDVFRGATVAAMVIVNNPGDWGAVYAPLLHAEWHGWTPTDLVFPFFLFIVGVAITLARTTTGTLRGVLGRGAAIAALGLFLSGFPYFNLATWRIPGVLMRIAICYVASVMLVRLVTSASMPLAEQIRRVAAMAVALLALYAGLLQFVPVPGGVAGDLSPAGNLGAWLDRLLMPGHLWREDWDPEGVLSTVPALGTTLLGVVAGLARRQTGDDARWRYGLLLGGIAALAAGGFWDRWLPINKNLWTSSYALFTAGAAAIALAICSLWSDGRLGTWQRRTSEPFVALGRNAMLLFVVSGLTARLMGLIRIGGPGSATLKAWIYGSVFVPLASPKAASLLFAVANLSLLYALLAWLHRRQLYWKA